MVERILLTGATGFLGSHLTKKLVTDGVIVRALVRNNARSDYGLLSQFGNEVIDQIEFIYGDLRDLPVIMKAAQDCDLIYHLGAINSIPFSYLHPVETVQSNVIGTMNILEAARLLKIPLVHTSSSEVYGHAYDLLIKEEYPLQGKSPFAASKIEADNLVDSYYVSYGLPVITLRPFNTYGPGQPACSVISSIISQALTQDHIILDSIETKYDFTYVDDIVNGFILAGKALLNAMSPQKTKNNPPIIDDEITKKKTITLVNPFIEVQDMKPFHAGSLDPYSGETLLADPHDTAPLLHQSPFIVDYDPSHVQVKEIGDKLESLSKPVMGEVINLGSGHAVIISEIVKEILKIVGKPDLPTQEYPQQRDYARHEMKTHIADYGKALELLNWQPSVNLEEGLAKTLDWVQDHIDQYQIGNYVR